MLRQREGNSKEISMRDNCKTGHCRALWSSVRPAGAPFFFFFIYIPDVSGFFVIIGMGPKENNKQ